MTVVKILPLLFAGLTLFAAGCSEEQPPPEVIDASVFAEAYVALVENREILQRWNTFNTKQFDADTTLERFGVTRKQLRQTIEYYNRDLKKWEGFYREVVRLQEEKK